MGAELRSRLIILTGLPQMRDSIFYFGQMLTWLNCRQWSIFQRGPVGFVSLTILLKLSSTRTTGWSVDHLRDAREGAFTLLEAAVAHWIDQPFGNHNVVPAKSLAPPGCVPKCPWARHWTPDEQVPSMFTPPLVCEWVNDKVSYTSYSMKSIPFINSCID